MAGHKTSSRPKFITVLAMLEAVLSLAYISATVFCIWMVYGPYSSSAYIIRFTDVALWTAASMTFLFAFLSGVAAVGLLRMKLWGYWIAVILNSAIAAIFFCVSVSNGFGMEGLLVAAVFIVFAVPYWLPAVRLALRHPLE